MSKENQSSIFIITGMHRSGTSLTASLMQSAGVHIGERLLAASHGNLKGHFENLDFLGFHEAALRSQGIRQEGWTAQEAFQISEEFVEKAKKVIEANQTITYWGWKDPRTTLFLDFWKHLLPQAYFIFTYRSPWEVIDSLYRRGDPIFHSDPEFALQVWMHYNKIILNFHQQFGERCILLDTKAIVADPSILSNLCEKKFGVNLREPEKDIIDTSLMQRIQSGSHRQILIEKVFPEAAELYNQLNNQADISGQQIPLEKSEFPESSRSWVLQDWLETYKITEYYKAESKRLQSLNEDYQSKLDYIHQQWQDTQTLLQETQQDLQYSQQQWHHSQAVIQAMETSKFWKLRQTWFEFKRSVGLKCK